MSCLREPLPTTRTTTTRRGPGGGAGRVGAASAVCLTLVLTACSGGGSTAAPSPSTTSASTTLLPERHHAEPGPERGERAGPAGRPHRRRAPAVRRRPGRRAGHGGRRAGLPSDAEDAGRAHRQDRQLEGHPDRGRDGRQGRHPRSQGADLAGGRRLVAVPGRQGAAARRQPAGALIGSDARTLQGQKVDRSPRRQPARRRGGRPRGWRRPRLRPRRLRAAVHRRPRQDQRRHGLRRPEGRAADGPQHHGLPIEGYLLTGFGGFRSIVNGAGGLPITLPRAVHDKASKADLGAGRQKLDGKKALAYSRARKSVAGGDFGRSANQGLVILAAAAMTRLAGPSALPAMLARAAPSLQTDLWPTRCSPSPRRCSSPTRQGRQQGGQGRLRHDVRRCVDRAARRPGPRLLRRPA